MDGDRDDPPARLLGMGEGLAVVLLHQGLSVDGDRVVDAVSHPLFFQVPGETVPILHLDGVLVVDVLAAVGDDRRVEVQVLVVKPRVLSPLLVEMVDHPQLG